MLRNTGAGRRRGINRIFLSIYNAGQSYTEGEHRTWLGELEIRHGAGPVGSSIIVARKRSSESGA